MTRRLILVLLVLLAGVQPSRAQVAGGTVPYTFIPNTTILSEEVNANFAALFTGAVDRTAGSLLGTLITKALEPSADQTFDLGSDTKRYKDLWLSGSVRGTGPTETLSVDCPQTTFGYSATRKWTTCTSSAGVVTFDAIASGGSPSFVFADPVTFSGGVAGVGAVPAGAVMFFDLAACPAGWTDLSATWGGRYIVIAMAGATLGTPSLTGTALTNMENRATGQHTHSVTDPGHTHSAEGSGGSDVEISAISGPDILGPVTTGSSTTGISIQNTGTTAGTNAPYVQLLTCKKD